MDIHFQPCKNGNFDNICTAWLNAGIRRLTMLYKCCQNVLMSNKQIIESARDKTYNKTCVTSTNSDQTVHPPSRARVSSIFL